MAEKFYEVELSEYNYDTRQTESKGTINLRTLAHSIKAGHLHYILENCLNGFGNPVKLGQEVGALFVNSHRTLQGCFVNFTLGLLVGFVTQYVKGWGYGDLTDITDPRNYSAVKAALKVKSLVDDGTIPFQPFI